MNRKSLSLLATAAILTCSCFGEVLVTTEQVNPADPAWNFRTIPRPSKSDLASGATISFLGNQPEPAAGEPSVLLDGVLPADSLDLSEEALFSNSDPAEGQILIDLGRTQPIAAVTTYSWHEWDVDGGSRAPQVYTLYANAAAAPDLKTSQPGRELPASIPGRIALVKNGMGNTGFLFTTQRVNSEAFVGSFLPWHPRARQDNRMLP